MIDILLGTVAAVATILVFRTYHPRRERAAWANALFIAALIYVGFALFGGGARWLAIESVGVVIYGAIAYAGRRLSPWFLAAGWIVHVVWDVGLHGEATPFVPGWYPVACIAYDVVVGLYIAFCCRAWSSRG